jgi:hypothetical protein
VPAREAEYDRLADTLLVHMDWELVCSLAGVSVPRPALARVGAD